MKDGDQAVTGALCVKAVLKLAMGEDCTKREQHGKIFTRL